MKYFYILFLSLLFSACKENNHKITEENNPFVNFDEAVKTSNQIGVKLDFQFSTGKTEEILNAVENRNYDYLNKIESEGNLSDFSLHIDFLDIDLLLNCISTYKNLKINKFRTNFVNTENCIDQKEFGAILLNKEFIELLSTLKESDVEIVSQNWFSEMAKKYPTEEIIVTNDAKESISKLISISKLAKTENTKMIFIWSI
jgi:hypothetical protein